MSNNLTVKRWTAKRKAVAIMDMFEGQDQGRQLAREHDPTVAWTEEAQRNMENWFRASHKNIPKQYEPEPRETKEALGESYSQIDVLKKFRRLFKKDENL